MLPAALRAASVLELVGHNGGDIRGLTLTFQRHDIDTNSTWVQVATLPPPLTHGPGPVVCDDSSGDDDELGIVKVKFGADDQGSLGIEFKEISIKTVNSSGMGQYRAAKTLESGMILRAINGVPADRLAFNACVSRTPLDFARTPLPLSLGCIRFLCS